MVKPYDASMKPVWMEIVSARAAYNHPDGQTFILTVHQALFAGAKQEPSLLNPNQPRWNGLWVDDVPCQFDRSSTHAIHLPDPEII